MKIDLNTTPAQIVFQSLRALATITLIGGIAIVFIQTGTENALSHTMDALSSAGDIIASYKG